MKPPSDCQREEQEEASTCDPDWMPGQPQPSGPAAPEPAGQFAPEMHTRADGLRYDDGKPRFDLLPPEAMEALARHYMAGAKKYEARNWEKGMAWGKCFGAMMRHAWAWMRGEDIDQETGNHHMIAVAWNAIALFTYAARNIGQDDRPKL